MPRGQKIETCEIPGCTKKANAGGGRYCGMHYSRLRRNGSPYIRTTRVYLTHELCTVDGCDYNVAGRGLCSKHWQQNKRRGDPLAPRLMGERWTDQEHEKALSILDRARDGLGWGQFGEVEDLSVVLGRSKIACHSKLHTLREKRLAGLPVP